MKNLLTKEAFAEWAEKQPADKEYDFHDVHNCALTQFAKFIGFENATAGGGYIRPVTGEDRIIDFGIDMEVVEYPRTFGALAARLRGSQP